jgi:uncharacterized membrane protein HdeD (DUF308 family)
MSSIAIERTESSVSWWLILLQGIASLIVGILLLTAPGATIAVMVQLLGAYWLVWGIVEIVALFVDRRNWILKLLSGILSVIAGLVVLQHPLWSAVLVPLTLVWVLGILALGSGLFTVIVALLDRSWAVAILGVLNILLGAILIANPILGVATLGLVLAGLAIIGGTGSITAAFRAR